MKTAIVAINERGAKLAAFIANGIGGSLRVKGTDFDSLSAWVESNFNEYEGFVFVMSLGIVNRVIAPLIKSKYTDPAVTVIDEVSRYVISALSGHEGGANRLAYLVSSITGASPVITTATEANRVYLCGVGARKGISKGKVIEAITEAASLVGITTKDIRGVATAWIKDKEAGIIEGVQELGLYLRFMPKALIQFYYERQARRSPLVYKYIGVHGVCEACAVLAGRHPVIVLKKTVFDGVTVAIARERLIEEEENGAILILGGTNESLLEAQRLLDSGVRFYISTATEYGYDHFLDKFPGNTVMERFTEETLTSFIIHNRITKVIDCTHPYAEVITQVAQVVCNRQNVEYVLRERKGLTLDENGHYERLVTVSSLEESGRVLVHLGLKRPLYTTGSKDLSFMKHLISLENVYVRVLPFEESIEACVKAGIKRSNIIAMQGPFTEELNVAMIKQYGIDAVITKLSGDTGGFSEKLNAAKTCGVWLIGYKQRGNK